VALFTHTPTQSTPQTPPRSTRRAANNAARPPDEVDLHGLHVSEAIARADRAVCAARAEGRQQLTFIVGRGLHSADGVARIKPALMEQLVTKHALRVTPGPNQGCLQVELVKPQQAGWFERLLGVGGRAQPGPTHGGGGAGGGRGSSNSGCVIC